MKKDFDLLEKEFLEKEQLRKKKKSKMKISGKGVFTLLKEMKKRKKKN